MLILLELFGVTCRHQQRPSVPPAAAVSAPNRVHFHLELSKLKGRKLTYLVRRHERRERRIHPRLQQSCHLRHAAMDLCSPSRSSGRACSAPTTPNHVRSALRQQHTSAPRHPPKGRTGAAQRRLGLASYNCM